MDGVTGGLTLHARKDVQSLRRADDEPQVEGHNRNIVPKVRTQTASSSQSKLLRRRSGITSHACQECRKKRTKCDGKIPCGRCKLRKNSDCIYKITERQSKREILAELNRTRKRQSFIEDILQAVLRPEHLEEVLARLQSEALMEDGVEGLELRQLLNKCITEARVDPDTASNELGGPPVISLTPNTPQDEQKNRELGHLKQVSSRLSPQFTQDHLSFLGTANMTENQNSNGQWRISAIEQSLSLHKAGQISMSISETWTCVIDDVETTYHLLALYFCWEYPNFAPVSKEHFLQDFIEGRHRYCSSMLVNAILALGCHHSDRNLAKARSSDLSSAGNDFFEESKRLFLSATDHHSLTTIQALVIMSIREARYSRVSESKYYAEQAMQLAIEMGLHRGYVEGYKDEPAVLSKTFWGAYALDNTCSLIIGTRPRCSCSLQLPAKPALTTDVETSPWAPYIEGDAHIRTYVQVSNVRSVYRSFCNLSELIHQTLYSLYSPNQHLTATILLRHYHQYLDWYNRLPEVMRLGLNSTPAVLFTHLHYHFAVLQLFQPSIKLRIIGSNLLPKEICLQSADAIQNLVSSYSKLYSLRRAPSFIPYFILASATILLAVSSSSVQIVPIKSAYGNPTILDRRVSEAVKHRILHLAEMAPYHNFAKQALDTIYYLARRWNLALESDGSKPFFEDQNNLFKQHISNINKNVPVNTPGCSDSESNHSGDKMEVQNVGLPLSALFWLQETPVQLDDQHLEQRGYATL